MIILNICENKKCSKPPTRDDLGVPLWLRKPPYITWYCVNIVVFLGTENNAADPTQLTPHWPEL